VLLIRSIGGPSNFPFLILIHTHGPCLFGDVIPDTLLVLNRLARLFIRFSSDFQSKADTNLDFYWCQDVVAYVRRLSFARVRKFRFPSGSYRAVPRGRFELL
jgi:hypothetical protein